MGLIKGHRKSIDLFLTDLGVKFDQRVIITNAMSKKVEKISEKSKKSNEKMVLEE